VSAPEDPKDKPTPAGRVKHDASGRAIWEWAAETGRNALDSTSRLLKRLEMPGLSLLDEDKDKKQAEEQSQRTDREAGFNPYEDANPRGTQPGKQIPTYGGQSEKDPLANARRSFNPYDKSKTTAPRPAQPVKPAKKTGILGRLFGKK
jgi:hypothetical protein